MDLEQVGKLTAIYRALAERANPNETIYFTPAEFQILRDCNLIVELKEGGLLQGPSHQVGGVYMLGEREGVFRAIAELEGWEFIINPLATKHFMEEIMQLNSFNDKITPFEEYTIPDNIAIIDANPLSFSGVKLKRYLLEAGSFFIVNKSATKFHLQRLSKINNSTI